MARGVLRDMAAPYSAAESFIYDRVIAPAVLRMGERIADQLANDVAADADVLDVGSGGGQLVLELAKRRPAARFTGLDLSAEQVERARARASAAHSSDKVSFVRGSAAAQPFEDESFDVVVSVASIKHWPEPRAGLAECVRVLRPGGRLFVFEADRGCRLADAAGFVHAWRVPSALGFVALAVFRTWVAGQSLDLDDARELLAELPLVDESVRRVSGTPALLLTGRKPRSAEL